MNDVAWASSMGRSYHLIATADKSREVKVFKLRREDLGTLKLDSVQSITAKADVWRIAWNATGTILATSTEAGDLDLWRRNFEGEWVSVQSITSGSGLNTQNCFRA